ncbi:DEAD/DEAH box helicase [bacterium]|nr:DEAD/DEAH box helicase [bacterium]
MDSLTTRFEKEVFSPYLEILKAQYRIHPMYAHAKKIWEEKLTLKELVNGPYLEKTQVYEPGDPLESLDLHEKTVKTIRKRLGDMENLYRHQTDALNLLLSGKNAVIATGTSSGKTLCYQIPILDDLIRNSTSGLRAVIIYPLNALVNDQLTEWEEMLKDHSHISFARFTGQTPDNQVEYESGLRAVIRDKLINEKLSQQELHKQIELRLADTVRNEIPNRLNHREDIRAKGPQILITNFSMLEYLLERPIDSSVFDNASLKYLVLDEAHAYRGVQATEISFLIRRLKDRLGIERLTCIATSATLGKKDDVESQKKVRKYSADMFGEEFNEPNPIYGTLATLKIEQPAYKPSALQYIQAAEAMRASSQADIRKYLGITVSDNDVAVILAHDENLFSLRKEILKKPILVSEAAKLLWPTDSNAENGLLALLEIVAGARRNGVHEDLLPTRLHYFVRAQDGLHICLHKECPGRKGGQPAFFVSRKADSEVLEGYCPECQQKGRSSKLVEVVTCRKCGYLYGALQDLGPRRAQTPENDSDAMRAAFDSFSTELGWAADSFWSYFCVENELPYPKEPKADEEDIDDVFQLEWCVICGKKHDSGAGDKCTCLTPHLRKIQIIHRQCFHSGKPKDLANLYSSQKRSLRACPNCGAQNSSGLEPVRRFQESDDETGLAMAIPLAHFQVTPVLDKKKPPRKLLCFTDHRQRAAAFPSLLEEETFVHDMGRKIVEITNAEGKSLDLVTLGERLADISDSQSNNYDPDFFLPVSRFPDGELDTRGGINLWIAETFSYFGIPDAARESAEDLGLVTAEYLLEEKEALVFHRLLNKSNLSLQDSTAALQILLGIIRQRKAFTLPTGRVHYSDPAFGRVTVDIAYILRREGVGKLQGKYVKGWLPRLNKDGTYRNNFVTDYLRRLLQLPPQEILNIAEKIWQFLTTEFLLIPHRETWKLGYERICVKKAPSRYVCKRCGYVTAYSAQQCCPRKECDGKLEIRPFDSAKENIIARWVADQIMPRFTNLKSEEHSAQISKPVAKRIEDEFRAEGINLLSSTTTFEMGINIGDLQKILLRNAPPTSASYVQRVGRAGRGIDKNAVCVTLCRRTKYDADAWQEPSRLMSGEVRTPTVFTQNPIIAQRHFNAVLFAKYLRENVLERQLLGELKQEIRLEPFLSSAIRDQSKLLPKPWLIFPPDLYLDFTSWLDRTSEQDVFSTSACLAILSAVGTFSIGKIEAIKKYTYILTAITDELETLLRERLQIVSYGRHVVDIDRSIKSLLRNGIINVLARRGFLPRYAFPLDVVSLETGPSRWSRESDVELSRDRGIAIAEFAPGAQVIAHKKVFTSEGLYIVSKRDVPEKRFYVRCRNCDQIRTASTQEKLKGRCLVCNKAVNPVQDIKIFVEPEAFSIRIDKHSEGSARYRRTTLIRQRQSLTHFIDSVKDDQFEDYGIFKLVLKVPGTLFRYNLGPNNGGFILCPHCGYSAPKKVFTIAKKHQRLRVFRGNADCIQQPWSKEIAYGHQFQSYCLIVRPAVPSTSIVSLAFALKKGLCTVLDIEPSDIGVSWRWLANKNDKVGEIILYDYAPGGAGFVKEGIDNWQQVVNITREICKVCKCEKACYDCLKDYGNQSYHEKLNRYTVTEFLRI